MTIQEILDYIAKTPENANVNVLGGMLDELTAGGGSSDFTEAHIVVDNQASGTTVVLFPYMLSEGAEGSLMVRMTEASYSGNVILYKGMAELHTVTTEDSLNVSLDGNIEYMSNNSYAITGDCSITILSDTPPTAE